MERHGRNSRQNSWGISLLLRPAPASGFSLGEGVKMCTQSCNTYVLWFSSLSSPCTVSVTNPSSRHHPVWAAQCGRRQWGQMDTDWETLLQGSPVLPEQPLKSKGQPAHNLGGNGQQSSCGFDNTNTHCGSDSRSHLLSGLQQLDLVSSTDAKPRSSPSALRKPMLVGGSHMVGCAELSCSIICLETKCRTSLPWNKLGSTNHGPTVYSPTVIKGFCFHRWQCLRLWVFVKTEKPNVALGRQKQMH